MYTNYYPNSIALMTVHLLQVEGNILTLQVLDALEGTLMLDIKSYM
jgi:tRNA (Thr-GGU) A37 N-methylase